MTEERLNHLELRLAGLTQQLLFVQGKALGLEAAVLTLVRQWGHEPQTVIEALHNTMETLDDPAQNRTLEGPEKQEALRVLEQVSSALHSRNR